MGRGGAEARRRGLAQRRYDETRTQRVLGDADRASPKRLRPGEDTETRRNAACTTKDTKDTKDTKKKKWRHGEMRLVSAEHQCPEMELQWPL